MKKKILSIISVCITMFAFAFPAYADESNPETVCLPDGSTVTYFEDGSSITVTTAQITEDTLLTRATTKSVTAQKDVRYTDSSGNLEWKYTLTGTFSYVPGVSSTCTKTSYTTTISNNSWAFSNGSATKSGNVATGNGTFKYKVLFITMKTYNIDIHLTCDTYGTVT